MNWLILMVALAQIDAPKAAPKVRREAVLTKVADPYDAVAWALQDALAMRVADPPTTAAGCLYLWIGPDENPKTAKVNSLAVNSSLSHSSTIQIPDLTANGRLIRWDCHKLCPKPEDFHRLVGVLNFLSIGEPFWHVDLKALGLPPAKVSPFVWIDGKTYSHISNVPAPATAEAYQLLQAETGLRVPLMRADYFLSRISRTVNQGVYYESRGFITHDQHGKKKRLNQAEIFRTVGADADLSRKVQADDRVGIVSSGVAYQPRVVEAGQGVAGGWRMTYDLNNDETRVAKNPFYNLLDAVNIADGREIIIELPNGLLAYLLTDGKGNLVDVAPDKLVSDHNVPRPHQTQLFPVISCVRCHAANGGVQNCPNDVRTLLKDGVKGDLDVFAEFGGTGLTIADIDRLSGLYGGDFDKRLRTARTQYADAVFIATRGMTAAEAGNAWASQYGAYAYESLDAQQQLLELGWKSRSPEAAKQALKTLLAPAGNELFIAGQKIALDDPMINAPRKGIAIRRADQERTFAEQFRRASVHRAEVRP